MSGLKDWDFEIDWDNMYTDKETEIVPDVNEYCFHEWKPIALIFTTVYDCKKCGKKKEDC
jgi:hypothetical protein